MPAEAAVWVDVEGAVREWAREQALGVGERVFFGTNNATTDPQVILHRVAGTDGDCLIQFDVWAATKSAAAATAAALATAADALSRFTADGVLLHGAVVESVRWQPDEESDTPRYVVEVTFTASASA